MRVLIKSQASCRGLFYRNLIIGRSSSDKFHLSLSCNGSKPASFRNHESFPKFFKKCADFQLLEEGEVAHADGIKMGFDCYTSSKNSIMSFYFKVGLKDSALDVFDQIARKDSVSWNAVIHGFLSDGEVRLGLHLFKEAMDVGFTPNVSTLILVLQACRMLKALPEGESLHGFIAKSGFAAEMSVQNSLLSLYGKSMDVEAAQKVFDEMRDKDVVSWSSLISGYAQSGDAVRGLQLFRSLSSENGIEVDGLVLVSVLQACSFIGHANHGKSLHSHAILRGFESDLFVSNSLIDMYSKCLDMDSALMVFAQMPHTNLVSWNSLLSGLLENEKYEEALLWFQSMKTAAGIDAYTTVILLQACKKLGEDALCRSIHSVVVRKLFESNEFVLNSLLDAYAKCGLMGPALKLFRKLPRRDVISWSTMISGYAQCGESREAISFFVAMRMAQEAPNSITLLSLLEACSTLADLKLSKCVNGVAVKHNLSNDLSVATALLDAYAKCGNLDLSRKVFLEMGERNVLSWNAMIRALGMNGRAREAIAAIDEMAAQDVKPNGVTVLSVLSACSHGGLVLEGLSLFQRMAGDYSVEPAMEHYSCIVDMLARAGDLNGGFEVMKKMTEEGAGACAPAWGSLLSASQRLGCREIGERVAGHVLELEPLSSAGYVLASSMFAKSGLHGEAARFRRLMKERQVRVVGGYSSIHVGLHARRFAAWDESDLRSGEIFSMAGLLHACMQRDDEHGLILELMGHAEGEYLPEIL